MQFIKMITNLKTSIIAALALTFVELAIWEIYWRSIEFYLILDANDSFWAKQRRKTEKTTVNDMILMGSSRALFDIQLNSREKETGIQPFQLACAYNSPLPVFQDLVRTVFVGVTPSLFFSTTSPKVQTSQWRQSRVDYYNNRIYALFFTTNLLEILKADEILVQTKPQY
ncbi:hypothetical protein [Algibacter mikhailovii]|uniref:hypothetical protein n=1 Tax=Algibacter mikhailovii TaxID=425498 RepID=UPI002494B5A7|nr:hypothetical protein [Algibacter mikhailovii]